MSSKLRLVLPNKKYLESYIEAYKEYKDNNVRAYDLYNPFKIDIFKKYEDYRLGRNLPNNYVKATYLWLVNDTDFIGEVSIRHELTPSLLRFGGNIGYGIRYSYWNKGYGTLQLKLALEYAKNLGLEKVLITCNDDNFASARVIEKNGGIFIDKVLNIIDGKTRITRRYYINIS